MQILTASKYLSRDERKMLMQKNTLSALVGIFTHWGLITAAFALVYFWTNPLTIIVSLFLLGGQQLGCAILMHDAGHYAVFKNKKWNDFVGNWLGAYPVFHNMQMYRNYHYVHHVNTGLEEDPDLLLTRGYPTSKKSMLRKFFRDFSGQTAIKSLVGLILMKLELMEYNMAGKVVRTSQENRSWKAFFVLFLSRLGKPILANLILFALLYFFASGYLYLLWIGAYLTTFQFSLRVRSIAEHSIVEDATDPLRNTRTTYANWLEKLLFAPYNVNFHVEHHLLMAVPSYNLPTMHKLLKKNGFYETGLLEASYWDVLKLAVKKTT